MSSNTTGEERIVSVTEKGQATIPKQLREKHGIPAPGRVKFVENEDGEIVVHPVGSMREFRGLERDGSEDQPATAVLREERDRDKQRADDLVERFSSESEDA
ncbi:AbrB/MazE/SpoVT family DNA-binding domain-containing protein [Natronolimnobius sp. AArcel1]|uniref:AbrB/MazE/SpoVT family DNA-binding domain-containing protein n=1 Tax=Natronolimnobius sp. AArcel1 TaxID=1679093 RepID=UPI0013EBD299|nr:AbrB/MazE/SpoVT family DNA-binding domain-containing protein [Natronolimnobius sp. AArcel1]NGM69884.1 AbrB/MazE/SpoVT family DNA-binding domain-containing protein [Natronolimnobius sp. AArcel1]